MPVLSLLRDKETDDDKKILSCDFQMLLVVFQISMTGGVERIWEVMEGKDQRHLEGLLRMFFNSLKMGPDSPFNH